MKKADEHRRQQMIAYAVEEIKNGQLTLNQIEQETINCYQDIQNGFLKENLDDRKITEMSNKLAQVNTESQAFGLETTEYDADFAQLNSKKIALTTEVQRITKKKHIQNELSSMLVVPPSDWSSENSITINEQATEPKLQQLTAEVVAQSDRWSMNVRDILTEMLTQTQTYHSLQQTIAAMETDGGTTVEQVVAMYAQLIDVENETLRAELSDRLDKIYNRLIGISS